MPKITELPSATTLTGAETFPLVQSGTTKYAAVSLVSPIKNVKQFGATGNGATDDTAAIQAAMTAGAGAAVYFPAGTYKTSSALVLASNTRYFGDGDASIIKSTALTSLGSGNSGGMTQMVGTNISGFRIDNLKLDASAITAFTAGCRNIFLFTCSKYSILDNTFTTPGGAVNSVACDHYMVKDNKLTFSATDGTCHSDGMIDQWSGSNNFSVVNNQINAANVGNYCVLVTGETSAAVAAGCYDFLVSGNQCFNANQDGIWINGRKGINYNFQVVSNLVDTTVNFDGIGIADCQYFTLSGNVVRNTRTRGLALYSETAAGGVTGAVDGTVSHNVVVNANMALNAANTTGAAIIIDNNSSGIALTGNRVSGTNHYTAITFGSSTLNCEVVGYDLAPGTSATIVNFVVSNTVPGGIAYTPSLTAVANVSASTAHACRVTRNGDLVTVVGELDITPTSAGVNTTLGISLLIASNFASVFTDCFGLAATAFSGLSGVIIADTVNKRASLQFTSTTNTANSFYFTFTYLVKA